MPGFLFLVENQIPAMMPTTARKGTKIWQRWPSRASCTPAYHPQCTVCKGFIDLKFLLGSSLNPHVIVWLSQMFHNFKVLWFSVKGSRCVECATQNVLYGGAKIKKLFIDKDVWGTPVWLNIELMPSILMQFHRHQGVRENWMPCYVSAGQINDCKHWTQNTVLGFHWSHRVAGELNWILKSVTTCYDLHGRRDLIRHPHHVPTPLLKGLG